MTLTLKLLTSLPAGELRRGDVLPAIGRRRQRRVVSGAYVDDGGYWCSVHFVGGGVWHGPAAILFNVERA